MATALLRASINGGAAQSGGIVGVTLGATLDLTNNDNAGIFNYRWVIAAPPDFTEPSGWSTDSDGNFYYEAAAPGGATPPQVTLNKWGKYMLTLYVNNAWQTGKAEHIDSTTGVLIYSPVTALEDVGTREGQQFHVQQWVRSVQNFLRQLEGIAAVATTSVAGFMSSTDKTKLDAMPPGSSGQIPYNDGAGAFGAEAGFEYDFANNRQTVPKIRATTQSEHYEGAAAAGERLWVDVPTGDVLESRTRNDADSSGNTFREVERQSTAVSRVQYTTQYGQTEVVDSYSAEYDTSASPAAQSLLRNKAGTAVALTAGYSYTWEVECEVHDGTSYGTIIYTVKARRPSAGNVALHSVKDDNDDALTLGLDMQFAQDTGNQYITFQPTLTGEGDDGNVRVNVRLKRRKAIATVFT